MYLLFETSESSLSVLDMFGLTNRIFEAITTLAGGFIPLAQSLQ